MVAGLPVVNLHSVIELTTQGIDMDTNPSLSNARHWNSSVAVGRNTGDAFFGLFSGFYRSKSPAYFTHDQCTDQNLRKYRAYRNFASDITGIVTEDNL